MSLKAIRLTIFGKVQGVGYRFYTQRKAQELNALLHQGRHSNRCIRKWVQADNQMYYKQ